MRDRILKSLLDGGAVAVIRMADAQKLMRVIEAIRDGGLSAIEVTMTTPNALKVIEEVSLTMAGDVLIGVGSVLDAPTARRAVEAGARYVVSPIFKSEIIDMAHVHDVPAIPGTFTPTEMQLAYEAGADLIKVFPADVVGMAFIKGIKAPLPHLPLMPTGGVTPTNAGEWIRAGASAVGVGSALLDKQAIAEDNYKKLTDNARTLRDSIERGRNM